MSETPRTDAKEEETELQKAQTHAYYGWKWARCLEKQLAERDAALARCAGGIDKAIAFLDEHDAGSPTSGSRVNCRAVAALMTLTQTKALLPTSAQATAKVLAAARRVAYYTTTKVGNPQEQADAMHDDLTGLVEAIREEYAYRSSDNS